MQINVYNEESVTVKPKVGKGGTLTDFLKTNDTPVGKLDAVNKAYVDQVFTNIDIAKINFGTLPSATLPAMSGDVVSGQGSNVLSIRPVTSAGAYARPVVNAKGQVLSGSKYTKDDLPLLPWSKVNTDLPNSPLGYGITDILGPDGGALNFNLTLNGDPTDPNHAANKNFTDTAMSGNLGVGTVATGTILLKYTLTTPTGFLKCNGGYISKTIYSALYNIIGDNTSPVMHIPGAGKPWEQQYYINDQYQINPGSWSDLQPLATGVYGAQAIVTYNRIYLLGGVVSTTGTASAVTYYANVDAIGRPGAWSPSTNLPDPLANSQAIVTKDRVYLLGGNNGSTKVNVIYTAPINNDGSLGNWTTAGTLPIGGIERCQAFITSNKLYLVGGVNDAGDYVNTVYVTTLDENGAISTWSPISRTLPTATASGSVFMVKDRVYYLGGNTVNGNYSTVVYMAVIDDAGDISAWTTTTSLPKGLSHMQVIVTEKKAFIFGGKSYGSNFAQVYASDINVDGSLGSWSEITPIPYNVYDGCVVITKGNAILIGGRDVNPLTKVYQAVITGGTSDYRAYYTGYTNTPLPYMTGIFRLPNIGFDAPDKAAYYIKY